MLGRHYLEESLQKAIEQGHTEPAKALINLIQQTATANLASFDAQGASFLCLAIALGRPEIASILLTIQHQDDAVLFASDNEGRSLIWHAVQRGYTDICKKLLELATQKNNKLWLVSDKTSTSPLHLAAQKIHSDIMQLLIDKISTEAKPTEIVNQTNNKGETALHFAVNLRLIEAMALLINLGADIHVHNDKKETPFDVLSTFDKQQQRQLFKLLNATTQKYLLKHYETAFSQQPDLISLRDIYFIYAGLHSLRELLIAHLEFNPQIPIQNTVKDFAGKEVFIDKQIYTQIPAYTARLLAAAKQMGVLAIESQATEKKNHPHNDWVQFHHERAMEGRSAYKILDEDRLTLKELLTSIENYMANVRRRPLVPASNKSLAVLVPIVCFAMTIALMIGLFYGGQATEGLTHKGHYDERKSWNTVYLIFYILTACVSFAGMVGTLIASVKYFYKKEANIDNREWRQFLGRLNRDVVDKLHQLETEAQQSNPRIDYLPTDAQNVRSLEGIVTELNRKHTITQTIDMFTRLKDILKTLQEDMNKSHRPLSLFAPRHVAIDIREGQEDRLVNERSGLLAL